jgi:DNA-binding protein HU-beta
MSMTKSQIAATLADRVGISKKQSQQFLEELANLAYDEAPNTFTLPGLGKLVMQDRPAREITLTLGPNKGQKKMVPAKKVVKFRVAKAAKDAITGGTR